MAESNDWRASLPIHTTPQLALWPLLGLSAVYFLLEFLPNALGGGYGYFIDELYYIACSKRLAWGYVDHPSLSPLLLAGALRALGISLATLRLLPALFGAASVLATGLLARRLGAGPFGQSLAALGWMVAPIPLILFGMYTVNALQLLIWTVLLYLLAEIGHGDDGRLWIWFGVLAGLGLENKHTLVVLPVALLVGLALTPARKHLLDWRLWLGAAIALLILLPNLVWQYQNGWPSLEFYRNASQLKNLPAPPGVVLGFQVLYMNPFSLLVWLPGLLALLCSWRLRRWRFMGWMFLVLLILLVLSQQSRPDRITGAYPVLFAAGGAFWGSIASRPRWKGARWALPTGLALSGLLLAPLGVPLLPPKLLEDYSGRLGLVPRLERGPGKTAELPQWFADRFGWEELVEDVAKVWWDLPDEERTGAIILAPSYGHAGAIELMGGQYELPPVVSPQNNYFLWGVPEGPIETVIALGFREETLSSLFEDVRQVGVYQCSHCMRWRNDMPIHLARRPKSDFHQAWPGFKHFE